MANRYARLKDRCASAQVPCPSPVDYAARLIDRAAKLAGNDVPFCDRYSRIVKRMPYVTAREIAAVLLSCRLLPHWNGAPRAPTVAADWFVQSIRTQRSPAHHECLTVH